ncbi:MAG: hypothetical protein HQ595_02190 [Candidatus Omnitrophica bacterium]|nr:hypothetical protein [Candidatus Omnitrophota bacterium]
MKKLTLAVTLLLVSVFLYPVQPAVEQAETFAQEQDHSEPLLIANAEVLSDEELDQVTGAGAFWLSGDSISADIVNWYSSGITDNAFQYAQGIMMPTQVTGDNNSIAVSLDLSILVFNVPDANALSTFPHLDSLISFP